MCAGGLQSHGGSTALVFAAMGGENPVIFFESPGEIGEIFKTAAVGGFSN